MFYSHEVLTSRKHGVATVWLVATLGSKSTLKKVDRKELVAVNIPKACETIVSPEAPMALRLQGSLLYGVSRVYGEQCNYVLKDAQTEQNKIRALMRTVHAAALTELESKHKAKPDQLTLQDDPNFMLDLAWGMDFDPFRSDIDMTSGDFSQQSSLLSPRRETSSALGSEHVDPALGNLIIPPSLSSSMAGAPALGLGGSVISNRHTHIPQEEGLLDDLGFTFDIDGNMVEDAPRDTERASSVHTPMPTLRDDVLPGEGYNDQPMEDIMGYGDDGQLPMGQDYDMQDVEPFPARNQQQGDEPAGAAGPDEADAEIIESSETAASAPAQRVRRVKILQPDTDLELHNRDLSQWNDNYLDLMQTLTQQKMQHRAVGLARKNADFWVLQNGVGGLGTFFGQDTMPEPLRMFQGNNLIEAITGLRLNVAGEKHARDEDGDAEATNNDRRVRARSDEGEAEVGRGDGDIPMPDDVGGNFADVGDETIEVGREGPTPLAEHLSLGMPWNMSASARDSSLQRGQAPFSAGGGMATSSVGGPAPFLGRVRTVSASPLVGRGRVDDNGAPLGMDDYQLLSDGIESNNYQDQHSLGQATQNTLLTHDNDFELFGAAAAVDTQTAGSFTWQRKALDSESGNFLSFVQAGIADADTARENAGEERSGTVTFDHLLPSIENNRIVAAQGLLHVLTLATKNLLKAEQPSVFGPVDMHLL